MLNCQVHILKSCQLFCTGTIWDLWTLTIPKHWLTRQKKCKLFFATENLRYYCFLFISGTAVIFVASFFMKMIQNNCMLWKFYTNSFCHSSNAGIGAQLMYMLVVLNMPFFTCSILGSGTRFVIQKWHVLCFCFFQSSTTAKPEFLWIIVAI